MKRRTYLVAGAVALSGCSGFGNQTASNPDPNGSNSDGRSTPSSTTGGSDTTPDPDPQDGGLLDDFEDLSMWTVREGSLTADTNRSLTGTQSARLEASRSERRVMIKRHFDEPRDLSAVWPGLAITGAQRANVVLQLTDTNSNRLLLRSTVRENGPFARHNLGLYDVVGDPDLGRVAHVKLSAWAGDTRAITVWCDDLHVVPRPGVGTVLLQFDGGYESVLTDALPILDEFGYDGTTFVNPTYVGADTRLSLDQLSTLDDAGLPIGSGGATGMRLTGMTDAEREAEVRTAAEWLDDHGFESGSRYFAYPKGWYDEAAVDLVSDYHDLGFIGPTPAHGSVTNPMLCPRAVNPAADEVRELLRLTATYRTITTLSYGDLTGDTRSAFETAVSYLSALDSAGRIVVGRPGDLASDHLGT